MTRASAVELGHYMVDYLIFSSTCADQCLVNRCSEQTHSHSKELPAGGHILKCALECETCIRKSYNNYALFESHEQWQIMWFNSSDSLLRRSRNAVYSSHCVCNIVFVPDNFFPFQDFNFHSHNSSVRGVDPLVWSDRFLSITSVGTT
jgi:hypothetical protein